MPEPDPQAAATPQAAVLLRRRRLVDATALTPPVRRSAWQWLRRPLTIQVGLSALQADLVQRGFLLSVSLYRYCASLSAPALAGFGSTLLDLLDAESGHDIEHTPLFRGFPESVPGNTDTFYINRVFARLLQEPAQLCVLCGDAKAVHAVSPCAHLVCRTCWDGSDLSACPLCLRRIDPKDPFLKPSFHEVQPAHVRSDRLRLLSLATPDSARRTVEALLVRRSPLSAVDRADLGVLLCGGDSSWLPDDIPVRETRALVIAHFLADDPELINRAGTATDVLRVLYALMDADPGLRTPPARRKSLPRATRRLVLQRLDRLPAETLVEDMLRHERAWKRIAENLHPFECAARYPVAALAFAILRRTDVDLATAAGRAVAGEAARNPFVRVEHGRLGDQHVRVAGRGCVGGRSAGACARPAASAAGGVGAAARAPGPGAAAGSAGCFGGRADDGGLGRVAGRDHGRARSGPHAAGRSAVVLPARRDGADLDDGGRAGALGGRAECGAGRRTGGRNVASGN